MVTYNKSDYLGSSKMEQHEEGGPEEVGVRRSGRSQTRDSKPRKFRDIRNNSARRGEIIFSVVTNDLDKSDDLITTFCRYRLPSVMFRNAMPLLINHSISVLFSELTAILSFLIRRHFLLNSGQ